MRVFKPTRKTKTGKVQQYSKWYVEFRDHLETIRRLPGYTDKRQTEELGRNVQRLVASRGNGFELEDDLGKWLESIPKRVRTKLADIGLIDRKKLAAGKTLAMHVDDFEASLNAKGNTEKHPRVVAGRARRLFAGCRFQQWSDITASSVEKHLADLRNGKKNLSAQTSNFYLQAGKQFCRWMIGDGRASASPLVTLKAMNVETDRRHDRRALSVEEMGWLLSVTSDSEHRHGVSGDERSLIYRLAVESGLRAKELRSLTRSSFDLKAESPTVTVEAGSSKRRRRDVLPLRADMAERLTAHLAHKMHHAKAFSIPSSDKTAKMIRGDLRESRQAWLERASDAAERDERERSSFLCYRDEAGLVADFHALRHTFITNLADSGVHPRIAQQLARHSTIQLTMDKYTHTVWSSLTDALEQLPDLSAAGARTREALPATGTMGAKESVALCVARTGTFESNSVRPDAVKTVSTSAIANSVSPEENRGNAEESEADGTGFEPAEDCSSVVFKTTAFDHSATHPDCAPETC
jgi:integrase